MGVNLDENWNNSGRNEWGESKQNAGDRTGFSLVSGYLEKKKRNSQKAAVTECKHVDIACWFSQAG